MLLTVNRPGGPLVVEAALGSSLRAAAGLGEDDLARTRAFLLGGYGGAWVSPQVFAELPVVGEGRPPRRCDTRRRCDRAAAS